MSKLTKKDDALDIVPANTVYSDTIAALGGLAITAAMIGFSCLLAEKTRGFLMM